MKKQLIRLRYVIQKILIDFVLGVVTFLNTILIRYSRRIINRSLDPSYLPSDVLPWVVLQYPEYAGIDLMIETGTCIGDTSYRERFKFKHIYTIEISEDLYSRSKARLAPWTNIICHHGDSAEILGKILEGIKERVVFFLDAHWSGDASVDWKRSKFQGSVDTGFSGKRENDGSVSSENQVPLQNEIRLIAEKHPYASVIIIDDVLNIGKKDHGFLGEDWSCVSIDGILSILGEERVRAFFTMGTKRDNSLIKILVILLHQK